MPRDVIQLLTATEAALTQQTVELAEARSRQLVSVISKAATGTGTIDALFSLGVRYRLVVVRCHFAGASGSAAMVLSLDSVLGAAYDARLFVVTRAGTDYDINLRIPAEESQDPSPWTFQVGDQLRVQWTNPDVGNITWGLQVGLAIAS